MKLKYSRRILVLKKMQYEIKKYIPTYSLFLLNGIERLYEET